MIFNELYGIYYKVMAEIIKEALDHPLKNAEWQKIIAQYAFPDSRLQIEKKISNNNWPILLKDGKTAIQHTPTMPITTLEKRWMKSVSMDPRIRLFQDEIYDFPDVEPLFSNEDYYIFDQYSDGDPYEDPVYIKHFRMILEGIRQQTALEIEMLNRRGERIIIRCLPKGMEYSEKDDKFRMIGEGDNQTYTINVKRILSIHEWDGVLTVGDFIKKQEEIQKLVFELADEKNALERVLLHFAHYEKQAIKLNEKHYRIIMEYKKEDESEVLIRILSFGPVLKVVEPECMVNLIKERLVLQQSCAN